jgi:uncharacterized protein (TIGR03545 family)
MSFFKKGPILAALGALLMVWAVVFFCFDPLLKMALVSGGQAANGAKVDVGALRTRWLKGTLAITDVQVASAEEPMKNSVSFSEALFQLDVSAALRGKAVVRQASIKGIRFGTARKRDGRLPRTPPSKLSLAVREKLGFQKTESVGAQVKGNVAAEVDAAKLGGLKKVEDAKAKAAEVEARWKAKPDEAKAIEAEAKDIAEKLKALNSGGSDAASILRKAKDAQELQARIKALHARVDAVKKDAQNDLGAVAAAVKEADELRKKDLNGLLAAAGLPTLDPADLTRRLLGPQAAGKLASLLKWVRWAREKAAARKAAAPPPVARRAGVDIEFPRKHSYPQFLLEKATLDGQLDKELAGRDLKLGGMLTGVTSNPVLYGKPARLTLAGADAELTLNLEARLEQQQEPTAVVLEFDGSGFPLAGMELGDGEVGGALKGGRARVKGLLRSAGEEWDGLITATASGVSIEPKVALSGAAGRLVSDALRGLPGFTAKVGISGREDDLQLKVASDIGEVVAGAMKKAVAGELDAQRKQLEAKVNAAYEERLKAVRAQQEKLQAQLMGPLDKQKGELDRLMKESLGKAVGTPKLDLPKLFR